jgi:hypothetical protein
MCLITLLLWLEWIDMKWRMSSYWYFIQRVKIKEEEEEKDRDQD